MHIPIIIPTINDTSRDVHKDMQDNSLVFWVLKKLCTHTRSLHFKDKMHLDKNRVIGAHPRQGISP